MEQFCFEIDLIVFNIKLYRKSDNGVEPKQKITISPKVPKHKFDRK